MAAAIKIENLSKRFKLLDQRYTSLKERIIHLCKVPSKEFWALNDINLEIYEGQTIGLLGRNGSGKSTLLNCIAGIIKPTMGKVVLRGRLAAMLELGAGFHPELSGRDNIYLNASLLGFSKKEIDKRFDEIVAFSELDKFIDTQVKHYSSGMYARLGFAVSINVEPDILLIDEVLAVGDEAFQTKCMDKMRKFQKEGRTIILVTHAIDSVRSFADRAVVMSKGRIIEDGSPGEAIRAAREDMMIEGAVETEEKEPIKLAEIEPKVRISSVLIYGESNTPVVTSKGSLTIRFSYDTNLVGVNSYVVFSIFDSSGNLIYGHNTLSDEQSFKLGFQGEFAIEINNLPLLDGKYLVSFSLFNSENSEMLSSRESVDYFEVVNPGTSTGIVDLDPVFSHKSVQLSHETQSAN
jgi:ABC-2 type transport system ATP-binding protein